MKKIIFLLVTAILCTGLQSCEDDNDKIIAEPNAALQIKTPNTELVLQKSDVDTTAITLEWEPSDYGINTQIDYVIEMGVAATGFETSRVVGQTNETSFSWTVKELNSEILKLGLEPNAQSDLEIRVSSSIGTTQVEKLVSNTVIFTVTTYGEVILLRDLFLVGNAVDTNKDGIANDKDWNNNATNTYLFRDAENTNTYYFSGYFDANEFKLLESKGNWQPQWGLDGGSFTSSDILGDDPGPFVTSAAGYYSLQVNTEDLTYTLDPIDASAAPTYTTIGYIGTARTGDETGWNEDTDLFQSTFNPHIWYANDVELFDGVMKFRHSNDWPGNWGGTTALSGTTTTAGDPPAIPVIAGTYDIWFNDLDGRYILIPRS
ncbi:SusE domain-containing protein [Aquimarina sp. W85]|uniref:SusE domain-containing protein n=1 Tax=Aquimarina rhodophyticola TaxID=3342246 RepID=UPI00366DE3FE